ncbi:transglycosylase SLT domain-containing protein [Psychrosphaera sp. 1_MG-2023]|uniref:transglycosylase SLT domain-containing protein n=1 Tax=Psychrosphaera sp. 1_MG-2023 TaxID=3062643 RepID=UPI0026E1E283|nr:transglycosylase SLT domain-containing protein [Psychrosphaera sp. 1_MG-2023]MDO6720402.1 transglycosylase SLT domain-containing protein [Psychrosphaera sp. 1_MG-2023]
MKKILTTTCCIILSWQVYGVIVDDKTTTAAQAHKAEQEAQLAKFKLDNQLAFKSYRDAFRDGLAEYKGRVEQVWGYADVSTNSKWVHYSDDLSEKLVIDYENNAIGLQRSANQSLPETKQFIEDALKQKIGDKSVAESLGIDIVDIDQIAEQLISDANLAASAEFIRSNIDDLKKTKSQLQFQSTQLSLREQKKERSYIKEIDKEIAKTESLLRSGKAVSKDVIGSKVSLPNKRVDRALLYKTDVNKQAKYHGLPVSLIYAVMEVESSFNPRAQSPIPAFGLMQIVPTTAGLDVNRHLRKSSEAPSANELYQPPQNVLYGATYLAMLYQTYFKDIKNPLSKHYCVIAAYNTGMGNVSALFSRDGTKDLKKAANVINKLSAQQVHDKIKSRAHPETKRYITKVLDAQHYFEQNM